jgi:hypothetical protein
MLLMMSNQNVGGFKFLIFRISVLLILLKGVTKSFQELAIQQVMIHIASLKKDMIILEKSEFSALRNENEVGMNSFY